MAWSGAPSQANLTAWRGPAGAARNLAAHARGQQAGGTRPGLRRSTGTAAVSCSLRKWVCRHQDRLWRRQLVVAAADGARGRGGRGRADVARRWNPWVHHPTDGPAACVLLPGLPVLSPERATCGEWMSAEGRACRASWRCSRAQLPAAAVAAEVPLRLVRDRG